MGFLLERDALNGKAGSAFATINGENVEIFGLKKFESNAELQESDFKVVGTTLVQKKTTGIAMSGSATIYYGTPVFLNMIMEYLKTGKIPLFTFQITNEDGGTSVGKQVVALYNVKLQKVPIAILDSDADFLTSDISFSFTGLEVLNAFSDPTQLG